MKSPIALLAFVLVTVATACGSSDAAPRESGRRAQPAYVDTIVPLPEALRRFQAEAGAAPAGLEGGAPSRDALVRAFNAALAGHDTTALRALVLNQREFAHLYYPGTPYYTGSRGRLEPQIVWFLMQQNSEKGIGRALRRFGGPARELKGYRCPSAPLGGGDNVVWDGCMTRIGHGADGTVELRLFGGIVERAGVFKFVSYANDL